MNLGEFVQGKAQQPLPPAFTDNEADLDAFQKYCHAMMMKILTLFAIGLQVLPPSLSPTTLSISKHIPDRSLIRRLDLVLIPPHRRPIRLYFTPPPLPLHPPLPRLQTRSRHPRRRPLRLRLHHAPLPTPRPTGPRNHPPRIPTPEPRFRPHCSLDPRARLPSLHGIRSQSAHSCEYRRFAQPLDERAVQEYGA